MNQVTFLLAGAIGLINLSHAALNPVGGDLINDTTQNITWMRDANSFKTLCDANHAKFTSWQGSVNPPVDQTAVTICSNNGRMTWNDAEAWIAHLNSGGGYLGYADWRQPATAVQPDTTCESVIAVDNSPSWPEQRGGYNCRAVGNELAHLFNVSLNNPNDNGTGTTGGDVGSNCFDPPATGTTTGNEQSPAHCFDNAAPFTNAKSFFYWSSTVHLPIPSAAWSFSTILGYQDRNNKVSNTLYVWPVRPGNAVVSTPQSVPSMTPWGLGIIGLLLGWVAWRRLQ